MSRLLSINMAFCHSGYVDVDVIEVMTIFICMRLNVFIGDRFVMIDRFVLVLQINMRQIHDITIIRSHKKDELFTISLKNVIYPLKSKLC